MSRYDEVEEEYKQDLIDYIEYRNKLNTMLGMFTILDSDIQKMFLTDLMAYHSELEELLRSIINDEINGEGDRQYRSISGETS